MSSNIGLSLNGNLNTGLNFGFLGNTLQPVNTNYENDLFMPDFLKTNSSSCQTAAQNTVNQSQEQKQNPQTEHQSQSVFTTNQNDNQISQQQINDYIMAQNPSIAVTQKGNLYKKSSTFSKLGSSVGILTPVGMAISTVVSKGFSALSKKGLLVKVPLLGLAGYALGALADKFLNAKRASDADKDIQV